MPKDSGQPRVPALDRVAMKFVKHHLADKQAFAGFTGQDRSAWIAFLYAVELYGRSDERGQANAISAMYALIRAAQHKEDVLACFKKAIASVLDFVFEDDLWRRIAPVVGSDGSDPVQMWPCSGGARVCAHIYSKPSKKHTGYLDCKDCGVTWQGADNAEGAVSP